MKRWGSGSKAEIREVKAATTIRVRYGETDAMGWVYYAKYLDYFEVGRTELIRDIWKPYREIEEKGMRLPVIETGCRYIYGARYDEVLTIESVMTLPTAYRIRFDYQIYRDTDRKLLAEGFTEHCFVSSNGKPIRIPQDLYSAIAN
ncbi:MAG: acyl-CoA thioesterase [Calditrichota bacterium]